MLLKYLLEVTMSNRGVLSVQAAALYQLLYDTLQSYSVFMFSSTRCYQSLRPLGSYWSDYTED